MCNRCAHPRMGVARLWPKSHYTELHAESAGAQEWKREPRTRARQPSEKRPTPDAVTSESRGLRALFLCEGNAETHDSWSGVSRSVVRHLRAEGHTVRVCDADLYGMRRIGVALRTVAWPRRRWWVRHHLHASAFRARSEMCARAIRAAGPGFDVLLQVGATFSPPASCDLPLVLYCDSNAELSRLGAASGHSEGASLTVGELAEVRDREEQVYRRAAMIFTMSERLRRSFIEDFGIAPDKLVTVHCGPNVDALPPAVTEFRRPSPPTILFVGRDFDRKGGALLLEAFAEVRRRVPDARLRFVGGRPARRAAIPEGVECLGYLSRDDVEGSTAMREAYESASVFCIPTRFDPFGTSFVEAMLYGLPCVGPAVWAVPEIIAHEETGLLTPPGDPQALADALVRLLADPVAAARMGVAARARAESHFSWARIAATMSRTLQAVVGADAGLARGA